MSKFKEGDVFKEYGRSTSEYLVDKAYGDDVYDISEIGSISSWKQYRYQETGYKVIRNIKTNKKTNMLDKFLGLFDTEPAISLKKAGILDSKGLVTDDGMKIYFSFLFKNMKTEDDFIAKVVTPLAELNEKKD